MSKFGLGATAGSLMLNNLPTLKGQSSPYDSANEILQTVLIAEDLATTFYYNGLVGGAIQDPVLAGPGGTATNPGVGGNVSNVGYLRAALDQEISHANLFRKLGNFGAAGSSDPDQTFYFPIGTFDSLAFFMLALDTLESLLIGTYLTAVRELSYLAAQTSRSIPDGPPGGPYSSSQLEYFAMIAASILGVESEHRALGRVILNQTQPDLDQTRPNNVYYEQTDNLLAVHTGSHTAVAALSPYLTPSTGPGFSLATALAQASSIVLTSTGIPPSYVRAFFAASPNLIGVMPGAPGITQLSWNVPTASLIQVRVNAPDGPLFAASKNVGSATTGAWVTDGMAFYLQNASAGNATAAGNTLAVVIVRLLWLLP